MTISWWYAVCCFESLLSTDPKRCKVCVFTFDGILPWGILSRKNYKFPTVVEISLIGGSFTTQKHSAHFIFVFAVVY